jgi:alkylation response protein AidB-like acyl-CoA dehydrogenase
LRGRSEEVGVYIFEGTAEIQQLVIARAISGMHIN